MMVLFRDLFRRMGVIALWYAGILIIVMVVLQIFAKTTADLYVTLAIVSEGSTRIYMLVIGIVCPLTYLGHYLAVGVTRKRFAVGIFAAGAAQSLCFAVLRIPLLIMADEFSLTATLIPAMYGALTFLVGWTASVGFQYMRAVPIVVGLVCAAAAYFGMMVAFEWFGLPTLAHFPIAACGICIVGAALLRVVKRIPVPC
jgi:hypothetical protein